MRFLSLLMFALAILSSCMGKSKEQLVDEAYRLIENRQFEQALPLLDQAVKKDPRYAMALFYRGMVYFNMKSNQAAIIDWGKASELGYSSASTALEKMGFTPQGR